MFFFRIDRPAHDWIIYFLWCWDYVKNSKTLFLFDRYGSYRKNVINKTILFFNITAISQNLVQIKNMSIGWRNKKFVEKIYLILLDAYLSKNYSIYPKKLISKIVLFFDFTPVYQILRNFIYWVKCSRYSPLPHSPSPPLQPFFMAPSSVRIWISCRAILFFINK